MLSIIRTIIFLVLSMAALRANYDFQLVKFTDIFPAFCFPAALAFICLLLFKQRDKTQGSLKGRSFVAVGLGVSIVIAGISMIVPLVRIIAL